MSKNWAIAFILLIVILFAASGFLGYMSSNLNSKIGTLSDDIQAFVADTANQFSVTNSSIAGVGSELADFKTETNNDFSAVQDDITGLDSALTAFKSDTASKFTAAENSIDNLNSDLTSLGDEFSESTMNVRQVYDDVIGSVCKIIGDTGTGSGFIYSSDGYVVTCWHVIDGQNNIYVMLHDGRVAMATLIGSDRYSDVAILKIDMPNLIPLELSDSDSLVAGEPVMVVGNPLGIFESVTYGIVSRTKGMELSEYGWWICNLIQYDAPSNPGNSGGPVFNKEGQVIGIVSRGYNYRDISFAVSSNKINKVVQDILNDGAFHNPILPGNWSLDNLTPEIVIERELDSSFGVIFNLAQGMGQIQADDIIIAVDGVAIKDAADLFSYIAEFKSVGDTVELTLLRGTDTEIEESLTLIEGYIA